MPFAVMREAECSKGNENERQQEKVLQANKLRYNEVTFLEMQIQYDALNILTYSILNGNMWNKTAKISS